MSLTKTLILCLIMVQPRKIQPNLTEKLLTGMKKSQQTKQYYLSRIAVHAHLIYTQKKKFSQYLCFLMKSTILDISLSNCIHKLYYRN